MREEEQVRVFLVLVLLTFASAAQAAVDCATVRQYAKIYTRAQLSLMAASAGVRVTSQDEARMSRCLVSKRKKKWRR